MKEKIQWGRLFRRSAALFMATIAVWALLLCVGAGAAADAVRGLGESGNSSPRPWRRSWDRWPPGRRNRTA